MINEYIDYPLTDIAVDLETQLLYVDVSAPGFTKDNIEIVAEGDYIMIIGRSDKVVDENLEIIQGDIIRDNFQRKIVLNPKYINGEVVASIENGILELIIYPNKKFTKKIKIS